MKFDEILEHIGEFGWYQKRFYFILCLPALICGLQVLSPVFTLATPLHRCKLPKYSNDTYEIQNDYHEYLINISIPPSDVDSSDYSECMIYSDANFSAPYEFRWSNTSAPRSTRTCKEWVYDKSEYDLSAIEEFSIVCEDTIMRSHSNMVQFSGALFGAIFMGFIADCLGRKKAIMLTLLIQFSSSLGIYLAPSYQAMTIIRFFTGIAAYSLFAISATTGIELVGPAKRTFTGVVVEIYWCVGILLLLPIAYLLPNWRHIQLAMCILTVPLFSIWWLIPESPRWLLDKGRYTEVEDILQKICRSNQTKLPQDALIPETRTQCPHTKIWNMFTHRVLIVRTFIVFFNWLAVNLLYYGISLSLDNLAGSTYVNFLIGGVVELVAYAVCLLLLDRTGRKKMYCVSMFIGAISCLAVVLPITLGNQSHMWIATVLAMIGKLCSSACYAILYILSAELFPTVIRNSGIGFCSVFENIGGMISPYIADMGIVLGGAFAQGLPMTVFGTVSIIAAFLSLFLPETLHRTLPETIQDAIDFDKQLRYDRNDSKVPVVEVELQVPLTAKE
ncbi:organic cation transporter protein [Biomphalaria pfeifferi]|uniref:Organic cation transporter protein n=1 Tax=Biomphalaria pfeifferi TaxID=112525 RepID=A0AAD8FIA1_BIOPF|nr:organic cation transporter protein [Biomphalaria pfeifferi]